MPRGMELAYAIGTVGLFITLVSGLVLADSSERPDYSITVSDSLTNQVDRAELSADERALIDDAVGGTHVEPADYPEPAPAPPEPEGERRGLEDGEKKFVVVGERVLVVTVEVEETEFNGDVSELELLAVDRTDELVLRQDDLSRTTQAVLEYAHERRGTVGIHLPPPDKFDAEGYSPGTFNLFEGNSRFLTPHEGELVALEIEEKDALLEEISLAGLVVGLLMAAPLLTIRAQRRLNWWSSIGLNGAFALCVTAFFIIVASPPALSHPLKRYQALAQVPLIAAIVVMVTICSFVASSLAADFDAA